MTKLRKESFPFTSQGMDLARKATQRNRETIANRRLNQNFQQSEEITNANRAAQVQKAFPAGGGFNNTGMRTNPAVKPEGNYGGERMMTGNVIPPTASGVPMQPTHQTQPTQQDQLASRFSPSGRMTNPQNRNLNMDRRQPAPKQPQAGPQPQRKQPQRSPQRGFKKTGY